MRIASLSILLSAFSAHAEPSPSLQVGKLTLIPACSQEFPSLARSLSSAYEDLKIRNIASVPDVTWREIEKITVQTGTLSRPPSRLDCDELLAALLSRGMDVALRLMQEDAQLEERAALVRAAHPEGPIALGVRFRFDTLAAVVEQVRQDSPAFRAGIMPGDILVEFDGIRIERASQARLAIFESRTGVELPVSVQRHGNTIRLKVTVERSAR